MADENAKKTPIDANEVVGSLNTMTDSVGVIVLGFLFMLLLLAFLRSQRRERQLLRELGELKKSK
jgi:hypothetical protein